MTDGGESRWVGRQNIDHQRKELSGTTVCAKPDCDAELNQDGATLPADRGGIRVCQRDECLEYAAEARIGNMEVITLPSTPKPGSDDELVTDGGARVEEDGEESGEFSDRRLDIDEVPDGHKLVEVVGFEEVLVEADNVPEAKEKAFEQTDIPNPYTKRVGSHLPVSDERRSENKEGSS